MIFIVYSKRYQYMFAVTKRVTIYNLQVSYKFCSILSEAEISVNAEDKLIIATCATRFL